MIRVGSSVVFANRDNMEHHIKSFSSSKPFEIAVHKPGDKPAPIVFEKEGAVVAYCILHDWMRAYIYVADTPWFSITGEASGIAKIENVPAGDYEAIAWHPDLGQYKPPLVQKVTITATGSVESTFKFDFKARPVRQAPKNFGSGARTKLRSKKRAKLARFVIGLLAYSMRLARMPRLASASSRLFSPNMWPTPITTKWLSGDLK